MNDLPPEVHRMILEHLPADNRLFISRVCRLWCYLNKSFKRLEITALLSRKVIYDSVQNLLNDPKTEFNLDQLIQFQSELSQDTISLILDYCQDETIHAVHLITYQELFTCVWNRIMKSNKCQKSKLMKKLDKQIIDASNKNFSYRFYMTLSILEEHFDDIKLESPPETLICCIILSIKDNIQPYDPTIIKQISKIELLESGFDEKEIEPWINEIE